MKINKITIENILAIKKAQIDASRPIIFVSGNNEAGKSSVMDCVSMAITGDLRRVSLKKEAHWLLNGDSGSVEVIADGDTQFIATITKNGIKHSGSSKASPVMQYLLDMHKFANVSNDERRKLLFEISGLKATTEEIMRRMVELGINEKTASAITPFLRAGFPEAQKEAQSKARDAKASWRTITGETYGDKKAETWQAKKDGTLEAIRQAITENNNQLDAVNADFDAANQRYGAMKASADKAVNRNAEIVRLRDQAEKVDRIKRKLETDKQQVIELQARVKQASRATTGIGAEDVRCICPECDTELIFVAKDKKLVRYGDLCTDEEMSAKLPEYERALAICINAVKCSERDLVSAESAKIKLEALEKDIEGAPSDEALLAMTSTIEKLKGIKKTLADTINNLLTEEKALLEADSITAKAMEHHSRVMEWEEIAAALAPDGIPGEILRDSIRPFNDRMKNTAASAAWKTLEIDDDMNIFVDGRPYRLMSESAKWRADLLITEAISHLSNERFFAVDRCDVLDGTSRVQMFVLLDDLAKSGEVDSALIMGTFKHDQVLSIAEAFENVQAHWIERGLLSAIKKPVENMVA